MVIICFRKIKVKLRLTFLGVRQLVLRRVVTFVVDAFAVDVVVVVIVLGRALGVRKRDVPVVVVGLRGIISVPEKEYTYKNPIGSLWSLKS